MKFLIIGITGPAQSGKDTAADFIIGQVEGAYKKTSFADPIKEMLRAGLDLSTEQLYGKLKDVIDNRYECTPRHMLQTLGTEWGRTLINGNTWVIAMEDYLDTIGGLFIIPDIRFENEATLIRKYGRLIHITGRDDNIEAGADHISEKGVEVGSNDLIVRNDGNLDTFYNAIREAYETIIRGDLSK